MPREGAATSILETFIEEIKNAKGKQEIDVVRIMDKQREPLTQLERRYEKPIKDKYYEYLNRMAHAVMDEEKQRKTIDTYVAEVQDLAKAILVQIQKDKGSPSTAGIAQQGSARGFKKQFNICVKSVRKTVKVRRGSTKESAAIAICTKSVLQTRGRTMKKYRKGRLTTQKLKK